MATSKRRTTMAKLNRERKLIERRHLKDAKRRLRKDAAANPPTSPEEVLPDAEA